MKHVKFIFAVIFIFCVSNASYAQKGKFWLDVKTNVSQYGDNKNHLEVAASLGYNFTERLYANVTVEDAITMFEENGVKDHYKNGTLGLGLGYKVFTFGNASIDLRANGGMTLNNEAWKYFYYDGGVYLRRRIGIVTPSIGFGVRYYDSRNDNFKGHLRAYASLGCSIDF